MFFIIKKEEVSENLGNFLGDKCQIERDCQFIFKGDCNETWGEITSKIGQYVYQFFSSKFIYTHTALEFLAENFKDPVRAASDFIQETGWDGDLYAEIVASHFFNQEILNEIYNLKPLEKENIYTKKDVKSINYIKGGYYAYI